MNKHTKVRALFALALSLFLVAAAPSFGQETVGALAGTVTDAQDGAALPGVTLTANNQSTGASLIQVTNGSGGFRFPVLSIGNYTLTATLEGFQTVSQELRVSVGATTAADIKMPLGAIEDTIIVTGDAPLVDVTSTVSGVTINTGEFAERVPVSREVTQVALLAPGTTTGDTAFDGDTPGQSLTSIGGASVAENTYLVNGLNVTNFRNGLGGSNVPFEFVEEVQVKTGGYEAEFGRSTGGVLNMVTKSGSNRLRGGVSAYFQPESLQEQSPNYFNGFNQEENFESTEVNFSLGGPIFKDRAFFFGFYQLNDIESSSVGVTRETVSIRDDPYFGGKLDVNVTPSHRLEATYFTDEVTVQQTDSNIASFDDRTRTGVVGQGTYDAGGNNNVIKYTGIFGSNFVVSAQVGNNEFNRTTASDGDNFPYILDNRGDSTIALGNWVNWQAGEADDEREALRVDLDYFLGKHSLRAGLDDETNTSADLTFYSGHEYFRYFINGSRFPQVSPDAELTRFRVFEGGGTFETLSNAFYLQDSFELTDRLLVNAGVRFEDFNNKNALGESFIESKDQYAPRLGAIYDLRGDGRSKIFGNWGRYHLYIASNTNIRLAGAELFTEDWYVMPAGCDVVNPTQGSCLGDLLEANVFGNGTVPDVRTTKSEDVDPMYQDEISIGYEQMVGDNWSVGIRGTHREFGEIIEDITIDAALVAQGLADPGAFEYRLVNPGADFTGFYDPHDGSPLIPVAFSASELGYPEAQRDYYALEFTFNRRYADNWMFQGSYTWAHSYGNYEGYVRSDNGQDDAGITTLYDFAGLLDHGAGNLPNDRRYNVKLYGAYQWDNGLMLGSSVSARDGRPFGAFGVHPTDEFAALYGAESFFNQGVAVARGNGGRTDDVINIDLTAKYDFDLGRTNVSLRADAFNLLDDDTATELDELADEESGAINTTYLDATRFARARRVRFSVGFTF